MTTETVIYIGEPDKLTGPFETEREALYFYGFAHGTHGQHHERVGLYEPAQLDSDDEHRPIVAPDVETLAKAQALIKAEDPS